VAKKRSALKFLQGQFREEKRVEKVYLALVKGHWPTRRKVVEAPLRKNELQSGERVVRVALDGKTARTEFEVEERFGDRATLVTARPITGRTHQIRVHAAYAGFPLVGDEKYGDDTFNKEMKQLGFRRLFLHAASLAFDMPDGTRCVCEAPLPPDLEMPLATLRESVTK
jgi:23S rRNA pseudouridine955/2504/2580 synthase